MTTPAFDPAGVPVALGVEVRSKTPAQSGERE